MLPGAFVAKTSWVLNGEFLNSKYVLSDTLIAGYFCLVKFSFVVPGESVLPDAPVVNCRGSGTAHLFTLSMLCIIL